MPPLNALRAFEAAARHLNFRIAAEELNVTQAAVAQQVRGLEEYLGIKLFHRLPRRLELTEQGVSYQPEIRRAFELIAEATRALSTAPERLTISVTPTFASKWLIPRLPAFVESHPFVDLRIVATEKVSDFVRDDVDIAVRQGDGNFGPDVFSECLFEQELIAVCSPLLLKAGRAFLRATDLKQHVLLQDAHDLWPPFLKQACGSKMPAGARTLRFNQTALAIDAALAGQGIVLVNRFLVEPELQAGRLVQAMPGVLKGSTALYVVSPARPHRPEAVQRVRAWLFEMTKAAGHAANG